MTKASEVLSTAANLVGKPGGWTQGVYGRRNGAQVAIEDLATADCFCARGAVLRASNGLIPLAAEAALGRLARRRGYAHIADWNDAPSRTQDEVVAALRQYADELREAGQ